MKMTAPRRLTVDIELPLDKLVSTQIAAHRRELARKRSERGARDGIRRFLAAVMADAADPQLVIR